MTTREEQVEAFLAHESARLKPCEEEPKAHPDYSPFRGEPANFECSCGREFRFYEDESEGACWILRRARIDEDDQIPL